MKLISIVSLLIFWVPSLNADVTLTYSITEHKKGSTKKNSTLRMDQQFLRMDYDNPNQPISLIMKKGDSILTVIDHKKKKYTQIDINMINQMTEMLAAKMASMPEKQRKMMEKMLGSQINQKPPKAKVTKKKSEKIGNWPATLYAVSYEKKKNHTQVWLTEFKHLGLKPKDLDPLNHWIGVAEKSLANIKTKGAIFEKTFIAWQKLKDKGVVTKSSTKKGETLLTKVSRAKLQPATFVVPEGYQKQDAPTPKGANL